MTPSGSLCPHCGAPVRADAADCEHCGVDFAKWRKKQEARPAAPAAAGLLAGIPKSVLYLAGAAALLNLKALADVAFDNGKFKEYFDELMFMYKEDCDLSYRLRLAGWKIVLAEKAVAYHNRAVAAIGATNLNIALNRRNKSRLVKQWSFLNQWILLLKIKDLPFSLNVKLATAWYQLKSLVFVLLFEPYLLKELVVLWKLLPAIKKRREQLEIKVDVKRVELFMK